MEWLLIWFLFAAGGAAIGVPKDRGLLGFFLGLLFGPFGLLFICLIPGNRRTCPACKMRVHPEASICPHCRSEIGLPGKERKWSDAIR